VAEQPSLPKYNQLLWTTLCAVKELGHSARLDEIDERVIEREAFSDDQLAILHNDGPRSEIEYRLAWARTYLKGMGALSSGGRGVWETTPLGRELGADEIEPRWRAFVAERRARRQSKAGVEGSENQEGNGETEEEGWKEQLLRQMLEVSPSGFERLAERLLRKAGFVNTTVMGRSGDGGIDGAGVYRVSLVSFPVFFQCKRYRGSVGADKVRDFRGAMAGRGDKGLLITTGTFTREARLEATRDGAPPIDLIDGDRLCDLLKELQLGVRTTEKRIEEVEVVDSFFEELR
jgi:restriction system protein